MNRFTKRRLLAGVVGGVLFAAGAAVAADSQKTAFDKRDGIVRNTFGNCVRTKWQADSDACAPTPPAPEPMVQAPPPPPPPPVVSLDQRTVYFDFDSDKLTAESVAKLDALADIIKSSNQIIQAGVIGYADEMGDEEYNLALSQRRAEAVRKYLDSRVTIDTRVLELRGLGESNSVTSCAGVGNRAGKIACLSQDRRVEVAFKYRK